MKITRKKPDLRSLCVFPYTTQSVKVFEATLGKLPTCSFNLKLVDNNPVLQISPILERIDIEGIIALPLFCIFGATLILLIIRLETLVAKQVVQLLVIFCGLVWFSFISILRQLFQRNKELVDHVNLIFQSNLATQFENPQIPEKNKSIFQDIPGIMLPLKIIGINLLGLPVAILECCLGFAPITATAEQMFNL